MSLYAVMEPVIDYGHCQWVRTGAPTRNLFTADKAARRRNGRVIDLDSNRVIADFWTEPEPAPSLGRAEYRAKRAAAQIFRV